MSTFNFRAFSGGLTHKDMLQIDTWIKKAADKKKVMEERTKGGTRKIREIEDVACKSPEHNPPMHRVFSPGEWEHVCPSCGKIHRFIVPLTTL